MSNGKDSNLVAGIGLLSKITSREIALKVVKESSLIFILIGIYQGVFSYLAGFYNGLIDSVLYIVLGLILRHRSSRAAAVILLTLSVIAFAVKLSIRMGYTTEGGSNIFFVVILLIVAIRAVEATNKLHGRFAKESQ